MIKFSIVITTKNRLEDLKFTLNSLEKLMNREDVELLICDDFSSDGTQEFLKSEYQNHTLLFNTKSLGLIHNRNILNNLAKGKFIISLDDDANFLSEYVLENIENHFKENSKCAVLAFRIFWGKELPKTLDSKAKTERVSGFVGCGHVWRKSHWKSTPNYPTWFHFYGEENYASFQLFKNNLEVHYLPYILVHHRVNVKNRKKAKDYYKRLRRSLRSSWYLYLLFYPLKKVPKKLIYSVYKQFTGKVFKGDFKAIISIALAKIDLFLNLPNIYRLKNRLSNKEYQEYLKLPETKIYWTPEK